MEEASFVSISRFTAEANSLLNRLEKPSNNTGRFKYAGQQTRQWRSLDPIELASPLGVEQRRKLAETMGRLALNVFEPLVEGGGDDRSHLELIQWNMALDSAYQGVLAGEPMEAVRRQFQAVADATTHKVVIQASQYRQEHVDELLLNFSARAGTAFAELSQNALYRFSDQKARQIKRAVLAGLIEDSLLCAGKIFNPRSYRASGETKWELEKVQYQLLWFVYELAAWQESKENDEQPLLRFALVREKHPMRRSSPRRSFEAAKLVAGRMKLIHLQANNFKPTPYHPKIQRVIPPFHFKELVAMTPQILAEAQVFVNPDDDSAPQEVLWDFERLFYEV